MISLGDLILENTYGVTGVENVEIEAGANEHAKATITGIAENLSAYEQSVRGNEDTVVTLRAKDGQIIFAGYVETVACHFDKQIYHITVHLISTSVMMDHEKKSKSFQDVSLSYKDMLDMCVAEEKGGSYHFNEDEGKKIGVPLIRYRETTWEYAKRMASHFGTVLFPDETSLMPSFFLGYEKREDAIVVTSLRYGHGISDRYWQVKDKIECELSDFEYFRIQSYQMYQLCDCISFQNRRMYVLEKRVHLRRSVLVFEYLIGSRKYLSTPKAYRDGFPGLTILGKILKADGENVKIHLEIDEQQEEGKAYFYKWVPDTGSVMYCMPEKGTRVSLYFPDEDEQNAIVVSCVRENGSSCPGMTNPDNKNFANPQGMNMFLQEKQVGFNMESNEQMLNLLDEGGISIKAGLKVSFLAKEGIDISAKSVYLDSPSVLNIARDPNLKEEEVK